MPENIDLTNLIRVCEELDKARHNGDEWEFHKAVARFELDCDETTILSLLHRLQAAEKRVKDLETDYEAAQELISRQGMRLMQQENDLATAEADKEALLLEIQHLDEYWNGNSNEQAMWDACNHVQAECAKVLATAHPGTALTQRLVEMEEALRNVMETGERMRGWASNYTGMGSNIVSEDVGRWLSAYRKAKQALEGRT